MPRSSPIQTSFNAGKWGPLLQGRVDLEKYTSACNELKNFIPTVQGPALKRSGTRFLKTVKDQAKKSRLIPFEFSTEQAYVLELYEGGMRVLKDSGAVLEPAISSPNVTNGNPVGLVVAHSYTNGDEVYITGTPQNEINGRFFTVTGVSGSGFFLAGEDGTGRANGASGTVSRVYAITDSVGGNSLPWLEAELDAVSFVQSGDVLYLVHPNHPPHKITRTAHTSWTSEVIDFNWPAFRPENNLNDVFMIASENVGTSKTLRVRGGNFTRNALNCQYVSDITISSFVNPTQANPCVITTTSDHGYVTGDTVYIRNAGMTQLNDRYFVITRINDTSFSLDGEDSTSHTLFSGGDVDKISTEFQFTASMVGGYFKLREVPESTVPEWKPSADFRTISIRYPATTGWALAICQYAGNVYQSIRASINNLGITPPTSDSAEDRDVPNSDVSSFRFYNRGSGYGTITSVASDGYSCTINVNVPFPYSCSTVNPNNTNYANQSWEGQETVRWSEGAWSSENGYPRAVALFEDRLWFGGTKADPQTFWGSRTGNYEDFEQINDDASSSVQFTLAAAEINAIEWLAGDQQLMIGTRGGEFVASGSSRTEAITASNITVRQQSSYGVKPGIQPRFVDSSLLFLQRAGERLHQLSYSNESDSYIGPDLTALSNDILQPSAAELSYQPAPFRQLWVRLTDGKLVNLTYVSDQDVLGWAQLEIGGTGVEVESLASIPHPDGDQDQVWMIVKRTIDGATKRYIEYLEKPFSSSTTYADAFFVDSGLTYSGSATTTITGLDHLEGQVVKVFADGVVQSDKTVFGGAISITSASKVQVGLGYDARVQTMRLESGAADGTAQGRRKRVQQILLRVDNSSQSVSYGANFNKMDSWDMGAGATYSGDSPSFTMPGGYEREGRISIQHQDPTPFTLVAIMPQLSTESR